MINLCALCGGTGDRYDEAIEDWADPREDCPRCAGRGEQADRSRAADKPVGLYDMGLRITHLIIAREQALSLLQRAPSDRYVLAAIAALEHEPYAGEPGGPARDLTNDRFRDMPGRIARAEARAEGLPSNFQSLPMRLSQTAGFIAQGLSNPEIANALGLSSETVKTYVARLLRETGTRNRTELAIELNKQAAA